LVQEGSEHLGSCSKDPQEYITLPVRIFSRITFGCYQAFIFIFENFSSFFFKKEVPPPSSSTLFSANPSLP
jgi:hypothetical protein